MYRVEIYYRRSSTAENPYSTPVVYRYDDKQILFGYMLRINTNAILTICA